MTEGRSELSSATSNQYNLSVTLTVHFCHNYFSAVSTAPSQFLLLQRNAESSKEYWGVVERAEGNQWINATLTQKNAEGIVARKQ